MPSKPALNVFLTRALIIGIASCKNESSNPPAWFTTYSRLYYDVSNDTSSLPSHVLSVGPSLYDDAPFCNERPFDTPITSYPQYFGIFGNGLLKPRADGLYSTASGSCGWGGFSLIGFDNLNILPMPKPALPLRNNPLFCKSRFPQL